MRSGAPQLATTQVQGARIEAALAARGIKAKSYIAMRYWTPYTSDALNAIKADGIQRLLVLPLYPQYSISTSGSRFGSSSASSMPIRPCARCATWSSLLGTTARGT